MLSMSCKTKHKTSCKVKQEKKNSQIEASGYHESIQITSDMINRDFIKSAQNILILVSIYIRKKGGKKNENTMWGGDWAM